jgi:hypothetical protein
VELRWLGQKACDNRAAKLLLSVSLLCFTFHCPQFFLPDLLLLLLSDLLPFFSILLSLLLLLYVIFFFEVFFINFFKKENRPKEMAGVEEKDVSGVEEEKATPSTAPDAAAATAGGEEEEAGKHGDEEDTGAQIAPIVKLQEVSISTGEENEDVLLDIKAKLYRFDKDGTQWKERGVGQVKLLQHQQTKKVRLLMRQSRTLKICANHAGESSLQLSQVNEPQD